MGVVLSWTKYSSNTQRKFIKDANIVLIQFFTGNVTLMNSPAAVARLMCWCALARSERAAYRMSAAKLTRQWQLL